VEDGIEPTLSERLSGQLVIFSTAHRRATALVPLRRAGIFAGWADESTSLLLEWSAPVGAELDDRDAWRLASPHWTPKRERLLEAKLRRVEQGESEDPDEDDARESFRSQYLNIWPARRLVAAGRRALPLCDGDTWSHAADLYATPGEESPVTVAVEDWLGLAAAAAAATLLPDGRVLVWGDTFATRSDAYAWASFVVGNRAGCRLLVGASMGKAEAAEAVPGVELSTANSATSRAALPLVRSLVLSGRLAHSGDEELARQVTNNRLAPVAAGGLAIAHTGPRHDLLKAMAWATADRAEPSDDPPDFFIF